GFWVDFKRAVDVTVRDLVPDFGVNSSVLAGGKNLHQLGADGCVFGHRRPVGLHFELWRVVVDVGDIDHKVGGRVEQRLAGVDRKNGQIVERSTLAVERLGQPKYAGELVDQKLAGRLLDLVV